MGVQSTLHPPTLGRWLVNESTLTYALGVIGSLLYMSTSIPALVKVLRDRDAQAVSPVTLDLLVLSGMWWIIYSLDISNVPSLVSSCVAIISPIIIIGLKFASREFPWRALVTLAAGLLLLPLMNVYSPTDVGAIAAILTLSIVLPTAWSVLVKRRPAPNASILFWVIQALTALTWLVYGIIVGHPILGATGIIVAPTASMIALRLWSERMPQAAVA